MTFCGSSTRTTNSSLRSGFLAPKKFNRFVISIVLTILTRFELPYSDRIITYPPPVDMDASSGFSVTISSMLFLGVFFTFVLSVVVGPTG